MTRAITPRWQDLINLVVAAQERLTIFTPYFSRSGIDTIRTNARAVDVVFWSRMSLKDWARGFAAPEPLLSFMRSVNETGKVATLRIQPKLHAKAYIADSRSALLGSANLTGGGFANNIEVMMRLEATAASAALRTLTIASEPESRSWTADDLDRWIRRYKTTIRRAKSREDAIEAALQAAQDESDADLGLAQLERIDPDQATLDAFIEWLAGHRELPGASYLVMLHGEKVRQRRQGHLKQSFSAVFRFLQEHTPWIQRLAVAATDRDGIYSPDAQLLESWSRHLADHATDQNSLYRYSTLRKELRPSIGGIMTHSGGGASGTLKRVFPLVAKFMSDRRRR
jgi:hypothetical protein